MPYRFGYFWLPVVLTAGLGAWVLVGYAGHTAQPAHSTLETMPLRSSATEAAAAPKLSDPRAQQASLLNPGASTSEAITPEQTAPVDGLKIASQSWRRGGLGSNALVTFTLRNTNDYAVKNIELLCSFNRRDGSHLTDRKRVIPDVVNMRSRKTFARLHVGFVNVNADRAKCSLVAASHI